MENRLFFFFLCTVIAPHTIHNTIKEQKLNIHYLFVFAGGSDAVRSSANIERIIKRASRVFHTPEEKLTLYNVRKVRSLKYELYGTCVLNFFIFP